MHVLTAKAKVYTYYPLLHHRRNQAFSFTCLSLVDLSIIDGCSVSFHVAHVRLSVGLGLGRGNEGLFESWLRGLELPQDMSVDDLAEIAVETMKSPNSVACLSCHKFHMKL